MNLEGKIDLIKQAVLAIKEAILGKNVTPIGNVSTYAEAIDSIVTPNNQTKTVTSNGTVTYDVGYTGLESVTVNVNQTVQNKTITENGNYTADSGYVGLGTVNVNVQPDLDSKTITANGTYNANDDDLDGYSSVTVNVKDFKDMNYWEDVNGNYHNFKNSSNALFDIGITNLSTSLSPNFSVNPKKAYFSALKTISEPRALYTLFLECSTLIAVDFSNLETIDASNIFEGCFSNTALTSISFPSLKSFIPGQPYKNQFFGMLDGVTGCEVHFPMNLETDLSSVQSQIGGTNTIVLFDLPATS